MCIILYLHKKRKLKSYLKPIHKNNMKYLSLFLLATLSAVHARRLGQSAAGCPDADYYVFGDGYAAAFKSAPSSDAPDQLVKVWQPNDHDSQLHFGVNVGTSEQPVFAVLSENSDKLYRFAPCEVAGTTWHEHQI